MPRFPTVPRPSRAAAAAILLILPLLGCRSGSAPGPSSGATAPTISRSAPASPGETVYITDSGRKYHTVDCQSLAKSRTPTSRSDAERRDYEPCELCCTKGPGGAGLLNKREERTVYATRTGDKYHTARCSSLSKSRVSFSLREAKAKKLAPCEKCSPR